MRKSVRQRWRTRALSIPGTASTAKNAGMSSKRRPPSTISTAISPLRSSGITTLRRIGISCANAASKSSPKCPSAFRTAATLSNIRAASSASTASAGRTSTIPSSTTICIRTGLRATNSALRSPCWKSCAERANKNTPRCCKSAASTRLNWSVGKRPPTICT